MKLINICKIIYFTLFLITLVYSVDITKISEPIILFCFFRVPAYLCMTRALYLYYTSIPNDQNKLSNLIVRLND